MRYLKFGLRFDINFFPLFRFIPVQQNIAKTDIYSVFCIPRIYYHYDLLGNNNFIHGLKNSFRGT